MTQKQFTQELTLHFLKNARIFSGNVSGGDLNGAEREDVERCVATADAIARHLYVKTNGFFDPEPSK